MAFLTVQQEQVLLDGLFCGATNVSYDPPGINCFEPMLFRLIQQEVLIRPATGPSGAGKLLYNPEQIQCKCLEYLPINAFDADTI
jgi:hypothetical protein